LRPGDRALGPYRRYRPRAAELTVLRNQTGWQQPLQRVVIMARAVWQALLPVLVRGLPEYGNCRLAAKQMLRPNLDTFLLPHVLRICR
jgi:hypothetical protein